MKLLETQDLTYAERSTWGVCPVCDAIHGEPCDGRIGVPLGVNVNGQRPTEGAHLGRLQNAPVRKRIYVE
jgi:hypothetical protein